jgi:hypothetical protein
MDRNGKKPKADAGADKHPERSDTKAQTRDLLGKPEGDTPAVRDPGGVASPRAKSGSKGQRR